MLNSDDAGDLLGRAEMHEQLAEATHDEPARKMHLAMAAEFRRRAAELMGSGVMPHAPIARMEIPALG